MSFLHSIWKYFLDFVINILFRPPPDTAVRGDDILYIRYRYGGNEYLLTVPFKESIYPLSIFVTASLGELDVTQQAGVPYCRSIPYVFTCDEDVEIDTELLLT